MLETGHGRQTFERPALGDIVTLPDARALTVRMFADLPANDLHVRSLCILGELEVLLAVDARHSAVDVLLPVETLPPGAATAKALCDGAAAFWAPHLPAIGGAMGEVLFRLLMLRSTFSPFVVIDRSGEHVFFLRVGRWELGQLHVTRLPASPLDSVTVSRFAATVDTTPKVVVLPEKGVPLPRPARVTR